MSQPTVFSPVYIDLPTASMPGPQSVTVPVDAQAVLVFWFHFINLVSPGGSMKSLGASFANFTGNVDQKPSIGEPPYFSGVGCAWGKVTATGVQTITPEWTTYCTNGPHLALVFLKDINPDDFFVDSDSNVPGGSSVFASVTIASNSNCTVLGFEGKDGASEPPAQSGASTLLSGSGRGQGYRLSQVTSVGPASTDFTGTSTQYSGVAAISVKGLSGGSDTTDPTWPGGTTLGATAKTDTTVTLTASADATDNVGVTGYEWSSDDGASYPFTSLTKTFQFTALTPLTSYPFKSRAYDAAGRKSAPIALTTSTYRAGDTAANILANTGPIGAGQPGFLYAFASTVTSTDWLSYTIVSGPTPSGGTLDAQPDGRFTYTGPAPATMVIQPEVNGVNAAETITVTLYDQNDVTAPTLSSPTGTKTGTTTATGTVSTNEADGTLYYYASTNATETAETVVASGSSQSVTTTGVQNVSFSGLSTGTTYYAHYVQDDSDLNRSARVSSSSFTTDTPDTTAPTLTSPTGTKTGQTTASGTVSTNEANGTLYRLASTNATETAATVIAAALSQAVSATGVQNVSFTGLTAATTYYAHYVHRDAASNDSSVASSASFTTDAAPDETAPTLSDPTAYASGPTTASGTVTTNEATGTLYFLRNNSATATDVAVKAGLSQAVTAAGIQTVNVTGLTASTPGNYIHYLHRDAAGNDSLVSSSAAFTTPAAPPPGMKVIGAQPTKLIARPITRPIAIRQTD